MLHSITNALFELDINIQLAKISTPGAQVVDIFYVTDLSGEKLMSYDKHEQIKEKLLESPVCGLLIVLCLARFSELRARGTFLFKTGTVFLDKKLD